MTDPTPVLCVIQARMGSTRLPGKVLMDVAGRPLLRFLLDRLGGLTVGRHQVRLVVATSDRPTDDAVAECAAAAGVAVVRGPEDDVLARFGRALDTWPADHVIRVTADCPLLDPALVAEVLTAHLATGADYTSNTLIRTHPDGLDVEVVRADALRAAVAEATDPAEREHVTPFVYRRPERFRLAAVIAPERLGHLRWTVDTAADLDVVRDLAARLESGDAGWRALLSRLDPPAPVTDGLVPAVGATDPARPVLDVVRAGAVTATVTLERLAADSHDSAGTRVTPADGVVLDDADRALVADLVAGSAQFDLPLVVDDAARLEALWRGEFGNQYVARNSVDLPARIGFWRRTLDAYPAQSLLEVGCAHGDNFRYMAGMIDLERTCGVDINELSLDTLRATSPQVAAVQGAARYLPFRDRSFDAVVTIGLLIHQPDASLAAVIRDLARCADRWLMFGEYRADEPTEIEYRGRTGILFKRDYVRIVAELCPELRHVATEELTTEADGFDRVTWGVFERR